MLGKLSFRNAKRQAKDYIIYFITVVIAVALMFSFNSIAISEDISNLSENMEDFPQIITGISIIVVFVMAWLINYTMKFMLEKRSKEFGTYQILGIEKKSIANMFTLENIFIGFMAFVVGIFGGIILYQIFTSIIMNIFKQPYEIKLVFDLKAAQLTGMYLFGIFVLVLLNSRRKIKKTKVYDLLYAEKKNENNIIKSSKGNFILFIISIISFIVSIVIINNQFKNPNDIENMKILISIVILILGIYLFYISISSFIVKRYLENKSRKYKKDNMFLYRNLTSKINTMGFTMGTIAMLFTIIIIGGNLAQLMNNMLNNEIEMGYAFEIMIESKDGDFSKYKEYIQKNAKVTDMYEYKIYNIPTTEINRALENTVFNRKYYDDSILGLKDYNKLRKILGHEQVNLNEDEIIIHCMKTAAKEFNNYIKNNNNVEIAGKNLKIKEVKSENFSQVNFNGYTYCIVVPDNFIKEIETLKQKDDTNENMDFKYKLVAQTENTTDEKFYNELSKYIDSEEVMRTAIVDKEEQVYTMNMYNGRVMTKGKRTSESKSFYTIISFLAFYVALIFVMATATLLAIQQLSDSEKYKYRYQLLKKLGMDELEMNRTIFKQLFFYFIIPIIVPIIISIPIVLSIGNIFTIALTIQEIWRNMATVIGLLILVYGIYFIATDVQFGRNINGNM